MRLFNLFESMIRVPEELIDDVREFLYAYIVSFLTTIDHDENDVMALLDYIDHLPEHTTLYKSLKFNHPSNIVFKTEINVKKYKFKYDMQTDELKIMFVTEGPHNYGGFDKDNNTLILNVQHLKMMLANKDMNKQILKYLINEYINTIEHELQHFVQVNSFGKKDPKQLETGDNFDGSLESVIRNVTSPAEFLPTIRSEYNTFKNRVKALKNNAQINRNDKIQLLRYFVGDSSARVQRFSGILEDFESRVFYKLKEMDKDLWKKAVKTIINEIKNDESFLDYDEGNERF